MKMYKMFAPFALGTALALTGCASKKEPAPQNLDKPGQSYSASDSSLGKYRNILEGTKSEGFIPAAIILFSQSGEAYRNMTPAQKSECTACVESLAATLAEYAFETRDANPGIKNAMGVKAGAPVRIPRMPLGNGTYAPETTENAGLGAVARELNRRAMEYNRSLGCSDEKVPGLYPAANVMVTIVGNDPELLNRIAIEAGKFKPKPMSK